MKKITLFSVLMVLLCFITGILGACSGKGDHNEPSDNGTRIQMSFDGQTIYGTLNDNSVSRDLISRLPITLEFSDYSGTEKIAYLPDGSADWDMSDAPLPVHRQQEILRCILLGEIFPYFIVISGGQKALFRLADWTKVKLINRLL